MTATASVLLPLDRALAATEEQQQVLAVDASAWSWRTVVPAGLPATEPSNVPQGDLAVQYDGRPDAAPAKATYLRLALGALPPGTDVTTLTLVVPLDTAATQVGTAGPIVACALAKDFPTGQGLDPTTMPAEDCTGAPVGTIDPVAQTLSFALADLADRWLSGGANHGVVLRPDPASAAPDVLPYQVTFAAPKLVQGLLTAQVPDVVTPPAVEPPAVVLPPYAAPAPQVAPLPGLFAPQPAPAPAPQAAPQPAPVVVAPPQAPSAAAPVAFVPPVLHAATGSSQAGLVAGVVLGLLLLALIGWSMGDAAHPRAFVRAERRRLDRLAVGPIVLVQPPAVQRRQGRRPLSSAASTVTYS
jgi:hypothetical protein